MVKACLSDLPCVRVDGVVVAGPGLRVSLVSTFAVQQAAAHVCYATPESAQFASVYPRTSTVHNR